MLDVLARHGVRTAFFVVGSMLAEPAARACAVRARAEGHLIGNHTYTHRAPLGERPGKEAVRAEIERTQATIGPLAHDPPLFRPNGDGGKLDRRLLSEDAAAELQASGYTCVLWNAIPRDWADPVGWVETALRQVEERPWTLMVLHDIPGGAMDHLSASSPPCVIAAAASARTFRRRACRSPPAGRRGRWRIS